MSGASRDDAIGIATAYLRAMEARDLDAARGCVAERGVELIFPGGRVFTDIAAIIENSSGRYREVRKRIDRKDAWTEGATSRVLIAGTLYGRWPNGTPFDGIRFIDLFELRDGQIVRQEVWNDAGERLIAMTREGLT